MTGQDARAQRGAALIQWTLRWSAKTEPTAERSPRWEMADVSGLRVERVRDFGEPWLGLALWHRLGLHPLLASLIEPGKEEIPWQDIAAALTTARFCAQRSELGIAEHWYERTALEDITGIALSKINDDRLYRGLDVLAAHKDKLCAHLMERYRNWFGIRFKLFIYDVTSTFFKGRAECVWVIDRGMVSEKNIEFLRARKARYLVGTPKSQLRDFEKHLLDHDGWQEG